jgi:AraC-like DNA-binding protein/mannose-6-phosphate isomerase-like protein (cupin superfamily)
MSTASNIPVYSLDKFRTSKDMGKGFQVEVFDANRHFKVEYPHRHDFYEVLYIAKGSGFHIIDNNRYKIEPPCIFFLSPGQTHKLELSNDIDGYIFLFAADFYLLNQRNKNRLLTFPFFFSVERQNPPLYLANQEDSLFIKSLFIRGCSEITKENYSEEIIRSLLELILLTCNQLYPKEYGILSYSKGHLLVKNFLLLIEENYQNNLKVTDYANQLAITPNHLTQIVKQITGKTTTEILQETNIMEIKRLLIHTSLTVSEIALMMKFADQSYFTKYFKKMTGQTPLDYRRESMKST